MVQFRDREISRLRILNRRSSSAIITVTVVICFFPIAIYVSVAIKKHRKYCIRSFTANVNVLRYICRVAVACPKGTVLTVPIP